MKKHFLFAAAFAALLTCACSVEPMDPIQPEEEGEITILTADFASGDDETRTVRQSDGKVFWSPKDEISVVRGTNTYCKKFVSTNTEPAASAAFSGTMPVGSGSFWAVHPYNVDAYYTGSYLVTEVPGTQKAVEGSFDDDAFVSVAYSSSQSVTFYHVCGGVKFTLAESGIKQVRIQAIGDAKLSGVVGIARSGGRPVIRAYGDYLPYAEIIAPEGETLTPGEPYHIVTIPSTLNNGFTLTFVKENGEMAVRTVSKKATIQAGHFLSMTDPDDGLDWEKVFEFSPSSATVPAEGGVFGIQIRSTVACHIEVYSDWIHEAGVEGDLLTGATYYFRADRNTGAARDGLLVVCDDSTCNPFMVSQADGSGLKAITHHSLGLRFTATWCGYCPIMSESFRLARENLGDKFEYACMYAADGSSNYGFSDGNTLFSQYGLGGYPSGIIDGRFELQNYGSEYAAQLIAATINETELWYPAVTAIALTSSVSGRDITVKADVLAQAAESFKFTVLLLEDGIVGYQADYNAGAHQDFVHNRVARMTLSPSINGESFTASTIGQTKSFTYTKTVPSECNMDNLIVLAYVQRQFGDRPAIQSGNYGNWYVDNCRAAAVGTTVPLEVE